MSAQHCCRAPFWYEPEAGASFDGEVRNLVQGESDGDDGVAAVLAGGQTAPGARNAPFVCMAPAGDAAVAAASVSSASASSSRDAAATFLPRTQRWPGLLVLFDAAMLANSSPATAELSTSSASPAGRSLVPRVMAGSADASGTGGGGVSHSSGCGDFQRGTRGSARRRPVGVCSLAHCERIGDGCDVRCGFCSRQGRGWENGSAGTRGRRGGVQSRGGREGRGGRVGKGGGSACCRDVRDHQRNNQPTGVMQH